MTSDSNNKDDNTTMMKVEATVNDEKKNNDDNNNKSESKEEQKQSNEVKMKTEEETKSEEKKSSDSNEDGVITSPAKTDVLLGRGAKMWSHEGNRKFRDVVATYLKSYENAKLRIEKTMIVTDILKQVRKEGGRFIKLDPTTNTWKEVDKRTAIEKIGHAIRDRKALTQKKEYQKSMAQEWLAQQRRTANAIAPNHTGRPDLAGIDARYLPPESAVILSQKGLLQNRGPPIAPEMLGGYGMQPLSSNRLLDRRDALLKSTLGAQSLLNKPSILGPSAQGPKPNAALHRMLLVEEASRNLQTAKEALANFHQTQEAIQNLKRATDHPPSDPQSYMAMKRQPPGMQNANAPAGQTDASLMTLASLSSVVGAPKAPAPSSANASPNVSTAPTPGNLPRHFAL